MKTFIKTSGQLGPLLKQLRVEKGLSQAALGAKIGLSQERISRIEGRPESITVDQLLTVLMALDAAFSVEPRHSLQGQAVASVSASATLGIGDKENW
ncbi:HTH-type transcriptional regulator / antitoxin HipB [Noviherbaspirillum humi]|uniref:HTH-type transcriptional regulator / antitoxin HipB n=1 Tax=Noviherbaspirillum humi TaxID=1688639 RepID=A0A239GUY0_9BURK|nr:helix-turn-helix transcriptional regulator [Noviherbaspirillum humi]SNS73026.1 HTH-type transcriptional regulator / antitoxin HipB [Noviherbaspirillum humi]